MLDVEKELSKLSEHEIYYEKFCVKIRNGRLEEVEQMYKNLKMIHFNELFFVACFYMKKEMIGWLHSKKKEIMNNIMYKKIGYQVSALTKFRYPLYNKVDEYLDGQFMGESPVKNRTKVILVDIYHDVYAYALNNKRYGLINTLRDIGVDKSINFDDIIDYFIDQGNITYAIECDMLKKGDYMIDYGKDYYNYSRKIKFLSEYYESKVISKKMYNDFVLYFYENNYNYKNNSNDTKLEITMFMIRHCPSPELLKKYMNYIYSDAFYEMNHLGKMTVINWVYENFPHDDLFIECVRRDHIKYVKLFLEKKNSNDFPWIRLAIRNMCSLKVVQCMYEMNPSIIGTILEYAIENDAIEIVNWCLSKNVDINESHYELCAKNYSFAVMKKIMNDNTNESLVLSNDLFIKAVDRNDFEMLDWIVKKNPNVNTLYKGSYFYNIYNIDEAIRMMKLLIKLDHKNIGLVHKDFIRKMIYEKKFAFIQWLINKDEQMIIRLINHEIIMLLIIHNEFQMIKWIMERNPLMIISETVTIHTILKLIDNKDKYVIDLAKWIMGFYEFKRENIDNDIKKIVDKNIDFLEWIKASTNHSQRIMNSISKEIMDRFISNGNQKFIEFLIEKCPEKKELIDYESLKCAIMNNRYELALWIVQMNPNINITKNENELLKKSLEHNKSDHQITKWLLTLDPYTKHGFIERFNYCVFRNDLEMMKQMYKLNEDIVHEIVSHKRIFKRTCKLYNMDIAKWLLDIHVKLNNGKIDKNKFIKLAKNANFINFSDYIIRSYMYKMII
jgi:hypothetical protein